jgi:hypothetical protein
VVQYLLNIEEMNRPLRSGSEGREEDIFAFRRRDAEGKMLTA